MLIKKSKTNKNKYRQNET